MIAEFFLLLFVASPVLCSNTYYVTPNHDTLCPGQPCLTLSQYVQHFDHYFTSNTSFVFLAGDHSLHHDLALEDVTNIALIGDNSSLPKIASKIKCTMAVNIEFDAVLKVNITALAFASCGKESTINGAIHLTDAREVSLSDCIFHDNAFTAIFANHSSLTLNKIVFTNNSKCALRISNSTVTSIHDITFSNNSGDRGGAAAIISSFVNFTGTTVFENNLGNYGGSLYLQNSTVRFTGTNLFQNGYANISGGTLFAGSASVVSFHGNSSFNNNSANYGGSLCLQDTTAMFTGTNLFQNGYAKVSGGVMYAGSASVVTFHGNSSFNNNSANYGGSVYLYAEFASVVSFHGNSSFYNNSANYGGSLCLHAEFASVVSFHGNSSFNNNSANYGGSLCLQDTTVMFTGTNLFQNGYAKVSGGVMYAGSASVVSFHGNSSFNNNSANYGGSLCLQNTTATFTGSNLFQNGYANASGGVLYSEHASTLSFHGNSSFKNNSADHKGGGVYAYSSTMKFEGDSSFINTSAVLGGGIYAGNSTVTFGNGSFINNSAVSGGGIYAGNSIITFGYSNFINNSADKGGGGILTHDSLMSFEGNSSFINNPADNGGGIFALNVIINFEGDSSFISNLADYQGGGIWVYSDIINFEGDRSFKFINKLADYLINCSTINFKGESKFINNSADFGGVIFSFGSVMNFERDSSFIYNSANFGGGIWASNSTMNFKGDISFINELANYQGGGIFTACSTITFESGSSFINHSADTGGGILAYMSIMNFQEDTSFIENSAGIGGGIYAYSSTMNFAEECSFDLNTNSAVFGAGISAGSSTVNLDGNSRFINNFASIEGGGIIADTNTTINFDGKCQIYNNSASYGGGIMVSTSTLNFYGICSFINNSATYGGGIALDASTCSLFQQKSPRVYFTGNHAKRGGAINVFDSLHVLSQYCHKLSIVRRCFLQINPFEPSSNAVINVSLIFENNLASEGGDHLYGGTIDHCQNVYRFNDLHSRDLIETVSSGLSEDKLSDISSDPIKVCVCDITEYPDCNRNIYVSTYPGESFSITIVAVGQRNGTVAAVIQGIIDRESTANLKAEENFQSSNKTCTTLTYTVFSNASSEKIYLYAEGPCSPGVGQPLSITVDLQHCPDGFDLSPTTRACICEKRLQVYTKQCDINSQSMYRYDKSDFWVGYDNDTGGLILHPHCPFDYCTTVHVSFTLNDTDLQCNYNRSGLLCGKCQTDLSLALGTSQCLQCSNNFLGLLAVFALAGLLLVFLLLICRLTVAGGTISGLIFYANIVAVNQTIFFPQDPNLCMRMLNVFIAWLNLDLGIKTCFYNGMDAYAKTWLQFVFPIYIWVLVGIVIISSRYSQIVARTLGTNPVAVLATLFLLSYTKILRTILAALSFTNLQYPNDITQTVWLYDGNIAYFSSRHAPLFITAVIVFFALFLPYTLLLLLGQCLQTRSNWRILTWVNSPRFKTIMDAYHGPYKYERRYWPGLLLVIRFILQLIFSSNSLHDPSVNLLAINTCTIALLTLIWLVPGVYKKWHLEALEAFFILNLGILATATYHIKVTGGSQAAVVCTSVGAAFVIFIGIVVYHIKLQVRDILRERRIWNYRRLRALQADEETEAARATAENQVASQLDLERVITDETRALVPTTEVVVCKRETLLSMETD